MITALPNSGHHHATEEQGAKEYLKKRSGERKVDSRYS